MFKQNPFLLIGLGGMCALGVYFLFAQESSVLVRPPKEPMTGAELEQQAENLLKEAQSYPDKLKKLQEKLPEKINQTGHFILQAAEFSGTNKKGRRWRVYADEAVQPNNGSGAMYLEGVIASATSKKEEPITVEAPKGVFNENTEILTLDSGFKGQFRAYSGVGEALKVFLRTQQAEGRILKVDGPRGQMQAGTFFADGETEKARFTNNVRVTFFLKEKAAQ